MKILVTLALAAVIFSARLALNRPGHVMPSPVAWNYGGTIGAAGVAFLFAAGIVELVSWLIGRFA